MAFLQTSMRLERFHLFYVTKSSFMKQMFSNRSRRLIVTRNITDLFAARFTTSNINIWHQNTEHTATVTIQMGVYSFPYLNVKNIFFFVGFFFSFLYVLMLQEHKLSGFGTFTNPPKTATIKRKRPQTAQGCFFFFPSPLRVPKIYATYSHPVWRNRHHLYTMANWIAGYI